MKQIKHLSTFIFFLFLVAFALQSCTTSQDVVFVVMGENATVTEEMTASHLQEDLQKVLEKEVLIVNEKEGLPTEGQILLIGTITSNKTIAKLAEREVIILSEKFPGSRGGIRALATIKDQEIAVLAGSDVQGMQYAVYDYCKEILGVDPFEYWSGNRPPINHGLNLINFQNKVIPSPEIPILCYFENDVDELANIKGQKLEYDWKNYTELINSLVRIKYNAFHFFDMLGRPEFFLRPEYQAIRPDYEVRLSYIDSMICYAHDMGMKVQIDMALGYKIKPLDQDEADCWSENKQDWIDTWKYFFEETPISKADIFSLRPRNQVWDWEYISSCGEDKVEVFNDVYAELDKVIDHYKPDATKVLICYHDGMEMFNNGFNPPKDWIVAWSDDGYADFKYWPESTKGYDFGTYMHAGFWLNHTVHDPFPEKLDTIMKKMVNSYGANRYCLVNGQQFRPFLLNLEAYSKMADNVNAFDGEQFYIDWAGRYFGDVAGRYAVNSMKYLHKAQFNRVGYVQHLWEIREAISYLSNAPIERPGKTPTPYRYARVEEDYAPLVQRTLVLNNALSEALKGAEVMGEENVFYHDYILFPVQVYVDLLNFEEQLHAMSKAKKQFEDTGDKIYLEQALKGLDSARHTLDIVHERCITGDNNPTWQGWYSPENRRPNNGFPTQAMLDVVEDNLKSLN